MSLAPGTVLKGDHDYTIECVLGQGGFGITYLANSFIMVGRIKQNVKFTIKEFFMKQSCSRAADGSVVTGGDPAELKANLDDFVKEAEHLKAVKHPGVVAVNEIMKTNNTVYYVMEYLGDLSLGKYLKQRGTLPEDEAKLIVSTVGNALQTLHEKKMTHLDVKPDNIMLVDEGSGQFRPVLIDFGLSKHYNLFGSATSSLGAMGASNGYSPLEQYSGITEFSPTADVYALGATLFALLKGHAPKNAGDVNEAYLRKELADVSPQTQNAIVNAMKMAKGDRCQSIKEFIQQLGGNVTTSTTSSATQATGSETVSLSMKRGGGSAGKMKWIIIAVVALLVIGGAAFFLLGGGGSDDKEESASNDSTLVKPTEKKDTTATKQAEPAKPAPVLVQQLTINGGNFKLETGKKQTLTCTAQPAQHVETIEWSSDNETVAKVNKATGEVTAGQKAGTATIKATATQSGVSATVQLTVEAPAQSSAASAGKTNSTPAPANNAVSNGTVTLSKIPARFSGKLKGGQPYGDGTLTFTSNCTVGGKDYTAGQSLTGIALQTGIFQADNGDDIKIR